MRIALAFIIFLLFPVTTFGQLPKKSMKKVGQNPIWFLDSVEIDRNILEKLNPSDISNISIVKPKKSRKIPGGKGLDGAIYITTVKAAKEIYWEFFKRKSKES